MLSRKRAASISGGDLSTLRQRPRITGVRNERVSNDYSVGTDSSNLSRTVLPAGMVFKEFINRLKIPYMQNCVYGSIYIF